MLVSAVQRSESAIYIYIIYIYPLPLELLSQPPPPHHSRSSPSTTAYCILNTPHFHTCALSLAVPQNSIPRRSSGWNFNHPSKPVSKATSFLMKSSQKTLPSPHLECLGHLVISYLPLFACLIVNNLCMFLVFLTYQPPDGKGHMATSHTPLPHSFCIEQQTCVW